MPKQSYVGAVAFFVFLAGAAGAGIVSADLGACADRLWRFGLRWPCLVLQLFLLALLLALHFAREGWQALRRRFAGAGCGAGDRGVRTRAHWLRRRWRLPRPTLRLLVLLDLNVEQIADGFVVDARHHVFEQDECFFFELD